MHSIQNRNLLYLNSSDMPPVLMGEMNDAGWNVQLTNNVDSAANIVDQFAPHVAIAQFDGLNGSLADRKSVV